METDKIKKNKKIKKIILVMVILISVIVVVCLVVVFKLISRNKTNDEALFKELIQVDYLASYILMGNIEVGDATATFDGQEYYAVIDEKLKNYNSVTKIMDLFNKYYTESSSSHYRKYFSDPEYNHYYDFGGILYVLKKEPACQNFQEIPTDYTKTYNINPEEKEDTVILSTFYNDINLIKVDGNWRLRGLDFKCVDSN